MSSLSRALSILESFSNERPEQTLATAHRYQAELVTWGGLDRTSRGSYRVGMRLWQLGALAPGERVWRAQHFSYWMTSMLHRLPNADGFQVKNASLRSCTP